MARPIATLARGLQTAHLAALSGYTDPPPPGGGVADPWKGHESSCLALSLTGTGGVTRLRAQGGAVRLRCSVH